MSENRSQIRAGAVSRFRLRRHHLLDEVSVDAVTICRDICGAQAQVMSAAHLQLWARNHTITRNDIEDALWKRRRLVKTSLMRQTLHLIPADEFPLYVAAQQPSRMAGALRIMAKFGITREEADALTELILDALSCGPLGRSGIHAAVRPKVSKRVRDWMDRVWSMVRLPVAQGLICYGRAENKSESNEVTFIRVDQWLPRLKSKAISPAEAQCVLLRKYLRAYGPATLRDFSHWAGIGMQEVKVLRPLLDAELSDVPGDKNSALLLREDVAVLNSSRATKSSIRLLPSFDAYLLAHREKDHLVNAKHYKRIYRNQWWISPVVLIDGVIGATWSYKIKDKRLRVEIEPFGKILRPVRAGIEREAESLADFFERELELEFV